MLAAAARWLASPRRALALVGAGTTLLTLARVLVLVIEAYSAVWAERAADRASSRAADRAGGAVAGGPAAATDLSLAKNKNKQTKQNMNPPTPGRNPQPQLFFCGIIDNWEGYLQLFPEFLKNQQFLALSAENS